MDAQYRLGDMVDGFRFLLGYSGWYYQHGTDEENMGDRALIGEVPPTDVGFFIYTK